MNADLNRSRLHCRRLTRARARNFYFAFALLDRRRRDAVCAIYAFMRGSDDLIDDPNGGLPAQRRGRLEAWRNDLADVLAGRPAPDPLWPAFADAVRTYRIPERYFHEMIDGVGSDLERHSIGTLDELRRYCHQVASVAGLALIHILGFEDPRAPELAETCGFAFQLTNILRDVGEDCRQDRIYLPREDLERFGVSPADLAAGRPAGNFRRLMEFEVARARSLYQQSWPLIGLVDPSGRRALRVLISIYATLLSRIEGAPGEVLHRRIGLSRAEKLWIAAGALLGAKSSPEWLAPRARSSA